MNVVSGLLTDLIAISLFISTIAIWSAIACGA
jgi:hypothetical protein